MEDRIYTDVIVSSALEGGNLTLISCTRVGEITTVLNHKIVRLEENAIRDALISLGWIPPDGIEV